MNVYCSLLSGQGDIMYIVMSEEQWKSIPQDVNWNDVMLSAMTEVECADEEIDYEPFIVEFTSYNANDFFQYLKENEATVIDVYEGQIY
jgi:hypothetical protein